MRYPLAPAQLVDGIAYYPEPLPVLNEPFGSDNKKLFAGSVNMCALKHDGSLWCAGDNKYRKITAKPFEGKWNPATPATQMPVTCR